MLPFLPALPNVTLEEVVQEEIRWVRVQRLGSGLHVCACNIQFEWWGTGCEWCCRALLHAAAFESEQLDGCKTSCVGLGASVCLTQACALLSHPAGCSAFQQPVESVGIRSSYLRLGNLVRAGGKCCRVASMLMHVVCAVC